MLRGHPGRGKGVGSVSNGKIAEYLRYCINAVSFTACEVCPFRDDPEFPQDDKSAVCADKLMELAADRLEEEK